MSDDEYGPLADQLLRVAARGPLTIRLEGGGEDGGFVATVDELPGCGSQGETFAEVLSNVHDAIEGYLAVKFGVGLDES